MEEKIVPADLPAEEIHAESVSAEPTAEDILTMHAGEKKSKRVHYSRRYGAVDIVILVVLILFSFCCLYPLWNVLVGSFNEGLDYTKGGVYFWPRKWSFDNYALVLNDMRIWRGYLITIGRTLLGTLLHLLLTSLVAYGMSRRELPCPRVFHFINIFTMFFGGGLIPYFLVLKMLGLINTFWVYIIPNMYSVYNMIVIRSFIKGLPEDLHESAVMDGAGEFRIYFRIILPLMKPVLATVALWTIVWHWNSYLDSMYYVTNSDLYSLQYVLMRIINESSTPTGNGVMPLPPDIFERMNPKTVSLAAIIVSTLPVLAVYPFLQKYFAKGVMVGSLKG